MNRAYCLFSMAVACVSSCLQPAWGETLDQAWERALAANEGLRAAEKQVDSARHGLKSAKAARFPVFQLSGGYVALDKEPTIDIEEGLGMSFPESSRLNITNPVTGAAFDLSQFSNFELGQDTLGTAQFSAALPLYAGGQISGLIKVADAGLEGLQWQRDRVEKELKLTVGQAYVNVLRAQQAVNISEDELRTLRAHVQDVENLFDQGLVARNDLLAVRVAELESQQRSIMINNMLELARSFYNRLMDRPMDAPVNLDELIVPGAPLALEYYAEKAKTQRPELKALDAQVRALKSTAKVVLAGMMPQVGLVGGYMYLEMDALQDKSFGYGGVAMSWNLFDFGATRNQADSVVATAESYWEQFQEADEMIGLQVRQVWLSYKESLSRVDVTKQALASADENLEVARDRYRHGFGTNTEVLDAEVRRTAAYANNNNAVYDAVYNRLRLLQVTGEI